MADKINATGIGQAINRVEGHLKVRGMAKYSTEFSVKNKVYGHGINSTIAKGEIISIDTSEAEKLPGVLKIITYKNAEKLKTFDTEKAANSTTSIAPVLQTNKVHYYGEFVGLVVAETFEQAQHAARLVKYEYRKDSDPAIHFDKVKSKAYPPKNNPDYKLGDLNAGLAAADEKLDVTYVTPIEHHHPMELHAIIATWDNGKVMAYATQQMVNDCTIAISDTFQIPKENVRIVSAFVGGGFGSKLNTERHAILAVMASKLVGKPVQVTVTRQQMFTNTGMRQFNEQRMRVGSKKDGTLTALAHETFTHTSPIQEYVEPCGQVTKMLYNTPNNLVTYRVVPMNLQTPFAMRAPGEATGSFALESAMDEMAWKLKMDPIEFRIKNDTQTDLSEKKPFSSRLLTECLRIGAEKFGWKDYKIMPRSNKNGNWLIGYGMSAASRKAPYQKTNSKVILELEGTKVKATIQMDATDIGTGSYTIIAQTASEYLKIPVEQIKVELGDSNFPVTPGSGGSWGAASYSNGARAACENAIKTLKKNRNIKESEEVSVADLLKRNQVKRFESEGSAEPSQAFKDHSVYSFGANFSEVWVDKDTGVFKIKRMVNVGSAGKIINPKTAYGQIIGGLTMGAGMALAEQSKVEPNFGNFITRSLADYHVPVNLDMANIDVIFLPEEDKVANEIGVKGIGELGITSVAASIANAVFNATGKRMRDLPITPEKLINAPIEPGVVV